MESMPAPEISNEEIIVPDFIFKYDEMSSGYNMEESLEPAILFLKQFTGAKYSKALEALLETVPGKYSTHSYYQRELLRLILVKEHS